MRENIIYLLKNISKLQKEIFIKKISSLDTTYLERKNSDLYNNLKSQFENEELIKLDYYYSIFIKAHQEYFENQELNNEDDYLYDIETIEYVRTKILLLKGRE